MEEDNDNFIVFVLGFFFGVLIFALVGAIFMQNAEADIGLSQEAGDLICQKLTNNTNAYAVDWNYKQNEPRDALICEITHEMIDGGLIQIKN